MTSLFAFRLLASLSKEEATGTVILSPAERRRRNRQEMIQAISEAARAVMREEGVAALNLHEVARRVQLRTPSLYTYFPGKMALYDALYQLGLRLYIERSQQLDRHPTSYYDPHGPSGLGGLVLGVTRLQRRLRGQRSLRISAFPATVRS